MKSNYYISIMRMSQGNAIKDEITFLMQGHPKQTKDGAGQKTVSHSIKILFYIVNI